MNKLFKLILFFLFIAFIVYAGENYGAAGAKADSDLTLKDMLTYAIQDEYIARAGYYAIMNEFGNGRPFSNIVQAEESHVSWLAPLFQRYGFKVPIDNSNEHLIVPDNIKKALEIGIQAEIDNIAMYDMFLKNDIPQDVYDIFQELKSASENHLKAFKNGLRKY